MQADRPKQYLQLNGRLLIDHTLDRILSYPGLSQLVLVLSSEDPYWKQSKFADDQRIIRTKGGKERCHSVLNGLNALEGLAEDDDWVLVHDVARPCLRHSDLDKLLSDLPPDGAILATPTRDTMKRGVADSVGGSHITNTVERDQLWHALTPQVFRYSELKNALLKSLDDGFQVTDEASAIEYMGGAPRLIEGHSDNIKVTRPQDLAMAEFILEKIICE